MQQRNLGKSGLRVSLVGLGCNNFGGRSDFEAARKVIHKALDLGITLFDTADVYPMNNRGRSEEILGEVLGDRRKEVVIASKFGLPMDNAGNLQGGSRRYLMAAVEASLKRLKTDWIDLYQLHSPDPLTPIEETLRALDDLVRQGKLRYLGCSNFTAWQIVEAAWTSRHLGLNAFVSCQNEYSLLMREPDGELIPALKAYGMGLLPYFPLASGLLTGKYKRSLPLPEKSRLTYMATLANRFLTEANWQRVEALEEFCCARSHTLLELAFSWLSADATVASVIAGASTPGQLEQNAQAVNWTLTPEELSEVDRITALPKKRGPF